MSTDTFPLGLPSVSTPKDAECPPLGATAKLSPRRSNLCGYDEGPAEWRGLRRW
jgi:hypothetical protein